MKKHLQLLIVLVPVVIVIIIVLIARQGNFAVLNPQGFIAMKERALIFTAMGIMLSVAIPVVLATFFIAWKYRAENTKATYTPNWSGNIFLKSLWWGILMVLLIIFSGIVWVAAHQLDPYKPIDASVKPLTIEVVALQWKWLFIYPEQHIATVNVIEFPVNTPLNFRLTADAPMNSFWIPSLGSQIYAMASMETKLHLIANSIGDFPGGAAEINGSGFSGMRFTAKSRSKEEFDIWVKSIQSSNHPLGMATFNALDKPSEDTPVTYYSSVDSNLYNTIVEKYMKPTIDIKVKN